MISYYISKKASHKRCIVFKTQVQFWTFPENWLECSKSWNLMQFEPVFILWPTTTETRWHGCWQKFNKRLCLTLWGYVSACVCVLQGHLYEHLWCAAGCLTSCLAYCSAFRVMGKWATGRNDRITASNQLGCVVEVTGMIPNVTLKKKFNIYYLKMLQTPEWVNMPHSKNRPPLLVHHARFQVP